MGLDESPQLPGILGLLHVVFSAYNKEWRHNAMNYIQGADRIGVLALDALLGQFGTDDNNKGQGWITEVVSPILSKVMALELSPWLFSALHQELICRYGAMGQGSIMGHHAPANWSGRARKRPPDRQRCVQRV